MVASSGYCTSLGSEGWTRAKESYFFGVQQSVLDQPVPQIGFKVCEDQEILPVRTADLLLLIGLLEVWGSSPQS